MTPPSNRLATHSLGYVPPTRVWREFATPTGAQSFVRGSMPGVEADHEVSGYARFLPVARLRSDQAFLRDRLEERGIKCYVATDTKRHVSDLMVQAGVDELLGRAPVLEGATDLHAIVRSIYAKMESKR